MRVGRAARWMATTALIFVLAIVSVVARGAAHLQAAEPIHITGVVTAQNGSGVQNVAVTATNPGGTTVVYGPSATAADGSYQLDVEAGTYDFRFTPASGSGLNPVTQPNVTVLADQTINVQLSPTPPPPPTTHTFSGTARTSAGQPLSNLRISLGGGARVSSASPAGAFSLTVNAGVYSDLMADTGMFTLAYPNAPYPNYPNAVRITAAAGAPSFDLTTNDVTQDVQLPATTTLDVEVRDAAGNPVPAGKNVTANGTGSAGATVALVPGGPSAYTLESMGANASTDANGVAHLTVFGNVTFAAGQVCVSGVAGFASSFCSTAAVNSDNGTATITLTQPAPPTHTFSGVLRDANGNPVAGVTINLGDSHFVRTNATGQFSFTESPGQYDLRVQAGGALGPLNVPGLPQYFSFTADGSNKIDLRNNDITSDIVLPAATTITVLTKDAQGNAAPNIPVSASGSLGNYELLANGSQVFSVGVNGSVNSNAGGSATLTVFENASFGLSSVCATFAVSPTTICNETVLSAGTGGLVVTLTQQPPTPRYTFSGTLRDAAGNPVPGVTVNLGEFSHMRTDAAGHFTFTEDPGVFELRVQGGGAVGPLNVPGLPQFLNFEGQEIDLTSGDVTRDMQLPQTATVTVTVKDADGDPMTGANVSVGGGITGGFPLFVNDPAIFPGTGVSGTGTTAATGSASITVWRGATFAPGSICASILIFNQCNTVALDTVNGDLSLIFQQQPATPAAPTGLQAVSPAVTPQLSWTGVAGAAQYDVYRDGVVIGSSETTAYTDTTASDGTHEYYVVAVNGGGQSPASNTVTVVVDATPPLITVAAAPTPNAAGWNNSDVTVSFTCSDGGTGVVSCPASVIVSADTAGQAVSGTATDGAGNTANAALTVKLDKTLPTVDTFTLPSKTAAQTKTFTVPAADNLSGVVAGEYFYGTDPGAGNGTAMTYAGAALAGTLDTDLPVGVYQLYVRSRDNAGNWSTTRSAQLIVTQAGTTSAQASGSFTPNAANGDQLPQLGAANYVLAQYNMNVNFNSNRITAGSNASFTYTYGTTPLCGALPWFPGCQQMTFTATSFDSLVFTGTGNGNVSITGTATVTLGGTTTTNRFLILLTDGARAGGSDHYDLTIYDAGNPATVLYHASNGGTVRVQ
jgi:hypothetical protein